MKMKTLFYKNIYSNPSILLCNTLNHTEIHIHTDTETQTQRTTTMKQWCQWMAVEEKILAKTISLRIKHLKKNKTKKK